MMKGENVGSPKQGHHLSKMEPEDIDWRGTSELGVKGGGEYIIDLFF